MITYTIITFDFERSAQTMADDFDTMGIPFDFDHAEDGTYQIRTQVAYGISAEDHLLAMKNFSLGRGPHSASQVTF